MKRLQVTSCYMGTGSLKVHPGSSDKRRRNQDERKKEKEYYRPQQYERLQHDQRDGIYHWLVRKVPAKAAEGG